MEDCRAMDHFPTTLPGNGTPPGIGEFPLSHVQPSLSKGTQANSSWQPNFGNPRPRPELTVELLVQRKGKESVLRGRFQGDGFWLLEEGGYACDWHVTHWRSATTTP